jgi:predicted ribosomally synthesized peptide with nif11-like leader
MSIDRTTLNFLETLNRDRAMQDRMASALDGADDALQAAVAFANGEGFAVTAESLDAAKQALNESARLDESELEKVAGGFNPQPEPPARTSPTNSSLPTFDPKVSNDLLRW